MTDLSRWIELGPWVKLEDLPHKCAQRTGKPLIVVGPELESRLRDGRIPSRIQPNHLIRSTPAAYLTLQSVVSGQEPGTKSHSSSSTFPVPPQSDRGMTFDPTIQGNGGWDQVDWQQGDICSCPIEVHWPSVLEMIKDLKEPSEMTIDGHIIVAGLLQVEKFTNKTGRPSKYDWPGLDAALAAKLLDDGCPAAGTGEQAEMEKWAMNFFPSERQPAESAIRSHVSKAITARRQQIG